MIKVLPSSNPCPENQLLDYVRELQKLGVEYLHCDVMDGVFVENKCLSYDVLENIRNNTNILLDVHLMVDDVYNEVVKYSQLKPSIITIHYEAPKSIAEIKKVIKYLKSKQIMVGMSLKPNTQIEMIESYIKDLDLILIMSVEPGKSGQTFIADSIDKIKKAKNLTLDRDIIIEVDGGVNESNKDEIIKAGARFLVMGNAFYNSKDRLSLLSNIDKHYTK